MTGFGQTRQGSSTLIDRSLTVNFKFEEAWQESKILVNNLGKVNRPFPSSLGPLYKNEVKCSAFDLEMIFHFHANKTHFHKKGCALSLILKVRVFGTRKWPIVSIISGLFLGWESTSLWRNCWWWDDCKPWMMILLPVGCHLDGKVLSRVNWLL